MRVFVPGYTATHGERGGTALYPRQVTKQDTRYPASPEPSPVPCCGVSRLSRDSLSLQGRREAPSIPAPGSTDKVPSSHRLNCLSGRPGGAPHGLSCRLDLSLARGTNCPASLINSGDADSRALLRMYSGLQLVYDPIKASYLSMAKSHRRGDGQMIWRCSGIGGRTGEDGTRNLATSAVSWLC